MTQNIQLMPATKFCLSVLLATTAFATAFHYSRQQALAEKKGADISSSTITLTPPAPYPARQDPNFFQEVACGCTQAHETADQVRPDAKDLWDDIQMLENSGTVMGPALIDFAKKANLFYCYKDLPANRAGEYCENDGIVRFAKHQNAGSDEEVLMTNIHETIHAVQYKNGVFEKPNYWSIYQQQSSTLSYEAAAVAGEYIAALEFYTKGNQSLWTEKEKQNPDLCNTIATAYNTAIENKMSYPEAFKAAGTAAFSAVMKQQWWLDAYNDNVLSYYAYLLNADWLIAPSDFTTDRYTEEMARKTGYITPEFNFTAGIQKLPTFQEQIGNNTKMMHAFNYAYIEHLRLTVGTQHPAYIGSVAQQQKENNPYLGIDIKEAYKKWGPVQKTTKFLDILDTMTGPKPAPAPLAPIVVAKTTGLHPG